MKKILLTLSGLFFTMSSLIAESEGEGYINAIYVQQRETPPVIPEKVDLSSKESTPEGRVKIDTPFWIGEIEVTNAQYGALTPEHDSRYIAQFWKDHVYPGYEANRPDQPVIRVSYDQIVEYCQKLSAQTGLNIKLPTEGQLTLVSRLLHGNHRIMSDLD